MELQSRTIHGASSFLDEFIPISSSVMRFKTTRYTRRNEIHDSISIETSICHAGSTSRYGGWDFGD
jgi:hypothetical protein